MRLSVSYKPLDDGEMIQGDLKNVELFFIYDVFVSIDVAHTTVTIQCSIVLRRVKLT